MLPDVPLGAAVLHLHARLQAVGTAAPLPGAQHLLRQNQQRSPTALLQQLPLPSLFMFF